MSTDSTPQVDRIIALRVRGFKSLADVDLDLTKPVVMIGENGAGKSTIVQVLDILRLAADGVALDEVAGRHGGVLQLLRSGHDTCGITVSMSDHEEPGRVINYELTMMRPESGTMRFKERVAMRDVEPGEVQEIVHRDASEVVTYNPNPGFGDVVGSIDQFRSVLNAHFKEPVLGYVQRLRACLVDIRVHVPFSVRPTWVNEGGAAYSSARLPNKVRQVKALDRFGENLSALIFSLSQGSAKKWERFVDHARLGLGFDLAGIVVPALDDKSSGDVLMHVRFGSEDDTISVPATTLSDGQLTYLMLLAIAELTEAPGFVAIDEIETHLNPALIRYVMEMFQELAERGVGVFITTHSDYVLDAVDNDCTNIVIAELDGRRATRLRMVDTEALQKWLERYRGVGHLRSEGYLPHILRRPN